VGGGVGGGVGQSRPWVLGTLIYESQVRKRWTIDLNQSLISKHTYFRRYTVHVDELLNYYTNHCTYIKFIKFTH